MSLPQKMTPLRSAMQSCRACGRRSSSLLRSKAASPASRTSALRLPTPSQSRDFSKTSPRSLVEASPGTSAPSSPSTLPESMLTSTPGSRPGPAPSNPQSPSQYVSAPSSQHHTNPFPPLPPDSDVRTTIGKVSKIHTNTAYVERNTLAWDKRLQKYYNRTFHDLVHDPTSLLRIGDVVKYSFFTAGENATRERRHERLFDHLEANGVETGRGEKVTKRGFVVPEGKRLVMVGAKLEAINKKQRNSKGVRFVVREVVTPFGDGVAERMEGIKKAGWLVDHEKASKVLVRGKAAAKHERKTVTAQEKAPEEP